MTIENKYIEAYAKIKKGKNILLVTHERPDGDAISSVCAMSLLLDTLQKNYTIYSHDKPSTIFNFLDNAEKIDNTEIVNFEKFDLIIVLDCGSVKRTRLEEKITKRKKGQYVIEFDHHPKQEEYSDLEVRISNLSSTAELVYVFLKTNDIFIDKKIANCLLTGIMTDTINFLNPSTTEKTILIASELLKSGAHLPTINKNTWKNKNIASIKILGDVLNNLKINKKYNFAFSALTYQDMKEIKDSRESLDSIMDFLINVADVNGVMFLKEEKPGEIKGSIRTNHPSASMSKLANYLGGGGHHKAAGFKVSGKIIKTKNSWKIV